jgi:hypothetical protein
LRYKRKKISNYTSQEEVDRIMVKYKDKLYLFFTRGSKKEQEICNRMIISLVRLAQKGNVSARDELVTWVTYVTSDWIDRYPQIYKWGVYSDEVNDKIIGCALRYRYTGSFLGYLFKTLEYSGRGKPPMCSLDDKIGDTGRTRIDYVVVDNEDI